MPPRCRTSARGSCSPSAAGSGGRPRPLCGAGPRPDRRRAGDDRPDLVGALLAQDAQGDDPAPRARCGDSEPAQGDDLRRHHHGGHRRGEPDDWCVSVFEDNAGVVAFDDDHESASRSRRTTTPAPSSPTAARTPGSAASSATCSAPAWAAKPIANTDVFCFGPADTRRRRLPPGRCIHPRAVMQASWPASRDYGNRMGIPTVNGARLFDERYLGNPLVFCGTVGLIPARPRPRSRGRRPDRRRRRPHRARRHPRRDVLVRRADRRVATSCGGAVQIGNAITEKKLLDVILQARDRGLYTRHHRLRGRRLQLGGRRDGRASWGATSSWSACPSSTTGCRTRRSGSPRRRSGWCWPCRRRTGRRCGDLCAARTSRRRRSAASRRRPAAGPLRRAGRRRPRHAVPARRPAAVGGWRRARGRSPRHRTDRPGLPAEIDGRACWSGRSPTPTSQQGVDHPPVRPRGAGRQRRQAARRRRDDGPADAAVLRPVPRSWRGLAVGCGINPCYGDLDPYAMALLAVDEALRNVVAVGADPARTAILDNFCWGNPTSARSPRRPGARRARRATTPPSPTASRSSPARTASTTSTGWRTALAAPSPARCSSPPSASCPIPGA